ncbi:MAG: type I-MYXAN CRISPR-associated protein Cas6/Cmx6 [Parasulfuritortus sp.]|jgi:CRISPR-associated protein Cas6|nr:type I-MYXAN CRISPR-associated protein Cas6/Cmx6 [Parasulfuritortus sp.]
MYNQDWEAIKDFEHTARFKDVYFDLTGNEVPADHGQALFDALLAHIPWLKDESAVGVQSIHGAPTGRNDNLVINRRAKLVLRLPLARVDAVRSLCGKHLNTGAGDIVIGDLKEKFLTPYATLYAPMVDLGTGDEAAFLEAAHAELEKIGIRCGLIPGKKRKMALTEGEISGYSLMLHDISLQQSLLVQEDGLGCHRSFGCGIFVPHKSIKEVAIN